MRTVTVKLPDDLDSLVTRLARIEGTTRSSVVRRAIAAYDPTRRHGRPAKEAAPSFLDGVRDLVGIAKGPQDLSTHRKHLDGFGE